MKNLHLYIGSLLSLVALTAMGQRPVTPNDLIIDQVQFSAPNTYVFTANNTIIVSNGNGVTINAPAAVEMTAGNHIILHPGFTATPGALFTGEIASSFNPLKTKAPENNTTQQEPGIRVYPNPSTDGTFNIQTATELNNGQIDVLDLMGNVVYTTQVNGTVKTTVDISGLSKGIYLVRITGTEYSHTEKLVYK